MLRPRPHQDSYCDTLVWLQLFQKKKKKNFFFSLFFFICAICHPHCDPQLSTQFSPPCPTNGNPVGSNRLQRCRPAPSRNGASPARGATLKATSCWVSRISFVGQGHDYSEPKTRNPKHALLENERPAEQSPHLDDCSSPALLLHNLVPTPDGLFEQLLLPAQGVD
jgi:hypothetical protein